MNQSAFQRQSRYRNESGATIIIVTFFMVALFAFAALSLDVGNVLREQRKAQIATDAAALAGAILLTNGNDSVVITGATAVAKINGVTTNEIDAGATTGRWGDYPGEIQVGNWDTNRPAATRFEAGGTPRNAVRVPARRNVPLNFAPIVGLRNMSPVVVSVATLESLGAVYGLRPFTVSSNLINNVAVGQQFTVIENEVGSLNSGQWGQLDYQNTLEGVEWYKAMTNGYQGLIPTGNNWAVLSQGNNQVRQAFEYLINNRVLIAIPVVETFIGVPNNGNVNIVGFIGLEVNSYRNRGRNSEITFTLRQAIVSGTGGGIPGEYRPSGRFLVQ